MKIKIKPNSYYIRYYDDHYTIWSTDNKCAYVIAYKPENQPLIKYTKKEVWCTINRWQEYLNNISIKIKEISKEDVFLELL